MILETKFDTKRFMQKYIYFIDLFWAYKQGRSNAVVRKGGCLGRQFVGGPKIDKY